MQNTLNMKKNALTLVAICLVAMNLSAQTLQLSPEYAVDETALEETGKQSGDIELTLGGGGAVVRGDSVFGADISLSTNPLDAIPEIWVGVGQSLYWEPDFAGSTDLFVDWSLNAYRDIVYLNLGWSVGGLYDLDDVIWRTGPQAFVQVYTSDNAFLYAGANWDFVDEGDDGLRYSFGIGLTF
jgi:hypothetical protein